MKRILCFDYDAVIHRSSAMAQKRSIICTHVPTGDDYTFKTRTEFYGHHKKKAGGWLAEQKGLLLEDFEIHDVVTPEPLENALRTVKVTINGILEKFDCDDYYGYVGGSENFRLDIATLQPYKGNRTADKPVHHAACKDYVLANHNARVANGRESDDCLVSDAYSAMKEKRPWLGVIAEKDYKGCEGDWYDYTKKDMKKVRGFGKLWRGADGIDGHGRMFKYYQVCSSDDSDNYWAHCFSDKENGPVTAYNALKDCKNDTEAFLAMKEHFMYLYPEPKIITNFRGDSFEIDWFYVMNEMFQLAHLQRWKDDRINLKTAFKGLGIEV